MKAESSAYQKAIRRTARKIYFNYSSKIGTCFLSSVFFTLNTLSAEIPCPSSRTLKFCITENEYQNQLADWLTEFHADENCSETTYNIDINGIVETGIEDLSSFQYGEKQVGYISITAYWNYNGAQQSCSSSLFLFDLPALICSVPNINYTASCESLEEDFVNWKAGFQIGGGCNPQISYRVTLTNGSTTIYDNLEDIPAPAICGETVSTELIIEEEGFISKSCSSQFVSLNYLPTYHGTGLIGPSFVCAKMDGFEYHVSADYEGLDMIWTYTGLGIEQINSNGTSIEVGFLESASDGYLEVSIPTLGIRDSIFVSVATDSYCQVVCPENFIVSPFMLLASEAGTNKVYQAQIDLSINGSIDNNMQVKLYSGEKMELMPGFSVEKNATLSAEIRDCETDE